MRRYDDYVVIVPINGHRVLTQYQYKPGARLWCGGFPAGFRKRGESFLDAAKRELLEETSLSGAMTSMGQYYDNVSIGKEKFEIFFCRPVVVRQERRTDNPDEVEGNIINTWVGYRALRKMKMPGACMSLAKQLVLGQYAKMG